MTTAAAALLVPTDEVLRFDRSWRLELMRHDLPANDPGSWRRLVEARTSPGREAMKDLVAATGRMHGLGVVVAIDGNTWQGLPAATRRSFGSAELLCFLRVMRLVIDKLEGCGEPSPLSLQLQRDRNMLGAGMDAVERLLSADSRADGRLASIAFVHPWSDSHFAAIDLVLHTCMAQIDGGAQTGAGGRAQAAARQALPASFSLELWDKSLVDSQLESLEWGLPSVASGRKRRSDQGRTSS